MRSAYGDRFHWSCAQIMIAIWRLAVLKRLQGGDTNEVVNGEELVKQLEPEFVGIAFYRLEHMRRQFEYLVKQGWITHERLNTPQRGYGDDEGFRFTQQTRDVIFANETIDIGLFAAIFGQQDSGWFPYEEESP